MVSPDVENLIYEIKLSSVGPATVTGPNVVHEPSIMDMVMKLHYLRGVYFFSKEAVKELTVYEIKESMFYWLNSYYITCGRFRMSESGKPFIKCNDCGVRFIEAKCSMNIDEFVQLKDCSLQNRLFYNQVIGPELTFSPLVMIQLTWFKCGGMSVGLRWAHVLGDAFSATNFINMWGQVLAAQLKPSQTLSIPKYQAQVQMSTSNAETSTLPLSVKQVDPVGDYWIAPSNCKVGTFSFDIPDTKLTQLQSKISDQSQNRHIPYFVSISAVIWQCLAKIREEHEPKIVTICRSDGNGYLGNNPILSTVKTEMPVAKCELMDLVDFIMDQNMDDRIQIEQVVGKDQVVGDYVVYGANLTFVDLEQVNLYGLELNGIKPIFANYIGHGVGDEGVVLVLPSPDGGRTVTITLPEIQVSQLKTEMKKEFNTA